jgi:hypothetical protein
MDTAHKPRARKRAGSVFLTLVAFLFLIADSTERLQKITSLFPAKYSGYLPLLYGTLFVVALLLLNSAHKDELDATKQPDLASILETQLRLSNEVAKVDELKQQLQTVSANRPRSLTTEQMRRIAEHLRAWPAHADRANLRHMLVGASPHAHDGKAFAGQLKMAFENGGVWSGDVFDFTLGDPGDGRPEFQDENRRMLAAHEANLTVWGSDMAEHEGEPLDVVILGALRSAGVDVTHAPGPTSIGGEIAVIVGSGVLTEAVREVQRLREEVNALRPRALTPLQQDIIYRSVRRQLSYENARDRSVRVFTMADDRELRTYAGHIDGLLRRMGFEVYSSDWPDILPVKQRLADGLTLYGDDELAPSTRDVLQEAFASAGVPVRIQDREPIERAVSVGQRPSIHIMVGYKET